MPRTKGARDKGPRQRVRPDYDLREAHRLLGAALAEGEADVGPARRRAIALHASRRLIRYLASPAGGAAGESDADAEASRAG